MLQIILAPQKPCACNERACVLCIYMYISLSSWVRLHTRVFIGVVVSRAPAHVCGVFRIRYIATETEMRMPYRYSLGIHFHFFDFILALSSHTRARVMRTPFAFFWQQQRHAGCCSPPCISLIRTKSVRTSLTLSLLRSENGLRVQMLVLGAAYTAKYTRAHTHIHDEPCTAHSTASTKCDSMEFWSEKHDHDPAKSSARVSSNGIVRVVCCCVFFLSSFSFSLARIVRTQNNNGHQHTACLHNRMATKGKIQYGCVKMLCTYLMWKHRPTDTTVCVCT